MVYLQGTGYTTGAEYEVIRALRDVNEYEMFPGQQKLLKETGQPYEEVGRVKVIDTRSKTAIAQIEYACDGVNPGDTTIPFAEKQTRHLPRVRSALTASCPPASKVSGRIVMGKDFDSQLGTGQKVYINVGSNQGVKIGDYFRAVRSYEADLKDPVDSLSFKAAIAEDTQKKTPSVDPDDVHQRQWSSDSRARSASPRGRRDRDHRRDQHDGDRHDRLLDGRCACGRRRGTGSGELVLLVSAKRPRPGTGNRPRFLFYACSADNRPGEQSCRQSPCEEHEHVVQPGPDAAIRVCLRTLRR